MRCKSCDRENPDGKKYCKECGKELGVASSVTPIAIPNCPCGAPIRPDKRFCEACGQPYVSRGETPVIHTPLVLSEAQLRSRAEALGIAKSNDQYYEGKGELDDATTSVKEAGTAWEKSGPIAAEDSESADRSTSAVEEFCPSANCRSPLRAGAKFCVKCGTKLRAGSTTQALLEDVKVGPSSSSIQPPRAPVSPLPAVIVPQDSVTSHRVVQPEPKAEQPVPPVSVAAEKSDPNRDQKLTSSVQQEDAKTKKWPYTVELVAGAFFVFVFVLVGFYIVNGRQTYAVAPSPSFGSPTGEWKVVAHMANGNSYSVDASSLTKVGSVVTMWVLIDSGNPSSNKDPELSKMVRFSIECNDKRIRQLTAISYSEHNGSGVVRWRSDEVYAWESIEAGSSFEQLWKFACDAKSKVTHQEIDAKPKPDATQEISPEKGTVTPKLASMPAGSAVQGLEQDDCNQHDFTKNPSTIHLSKLVGEKNQRLFFFEDGRGCTYLENKCRTNAYVVTGDELLIKRSTGNWACAWFHGTKAQTVGWVKADRLIDLPVETDDPRLWVGKWMYGVGGSFASIIIFNQRGTLSAQGSATLKGGRPEARFPIIHSGEFEGVITPEKGRARLAEGSSVFCVVDFARIGKYLVVRDNWRCGGANVTFSAVYAKAQ